MTVVIAGSSGLAGSALARKFTASGHEVIGINRSVLDLRDSVKTQEFIADTKPNLIIDAAAKVGGIGANNSFPVDFLQDNILIQTNLMQAAHKANVKNFIFLGSSCVYPRDCPQPIKEEYLMSGPLESTNSAYALAKIAGIELINSYRKQYGYDWISLMPTNLYGPKDNFSLESSHVLPALIRKFVEATEANAQSVTAWGTGTPTREFLHADDMASAVLIASEKYNSSMHLNIGSGTEISIKSLVELVAQIVEFKGRIQWDLSKLDGTPRKILDVTRVRELGWAPLFTLETGIASTVTWYKEAIKEGQVRL